MRARPSAAASQCAAARPSVQPAVQHRDRCRGSRAATCADQLRRQRDLGHEHSTCASRSRRARAPASAGRPRSCRCRSRRAAGAPRSPGPRTAHRPPPAVRPTTAAHREHRQLAAAQPQPHQAQPYRTRPSRARGIASHRLRARSKTRRRAPSPRWRAQQLRNCRQGDFAQLAVVVARCKADQVDPVRVGHRGSGHRPERAAQPLRGNLGAIAKLGDDADAPSPAPGHQHPRTRHDRVAVLGFDAVIEATGGRHVERHACDRFGLGGSHGHGRQPEFTLTLRVNLRRCRPFSRPFTKAVDKTVGSAPRSPRNPRQCSTVGRMHVFST